MPWPSTAFLDKALPQSSPPSLLLDTAWKTLNMVAYAAKDWPELPENSEERRFTATVGPCDEKVHARSDLKVHGSDQDIPVR
jgi:hypothetical protein